MVLLEAAPLSSQLLLQAALSQLVHLLLLLSQLVLPSQVVRVQVSAT